MSKKTNTISVYLLKEGFYGTNALKNGHPLSQLEECSIPDEALLFLYRPHGREPWWKSYLGIEQSLFQSLNGAILFLKNNGHGYAIVFGNVAHYLDPNGYEYDFGIKTTLNATDANKLKSMDSVEPESARRNRIQAPSVEELSYFDVAENDRVFKKISGTVKDEFKTWFSSLTGSDNARVATQKKVDELGPLCDQLYRLYTSDEYKNLFPGFRNICRISDPHVIETLNNKLVTAIKEKDPTLILSVPDNLKYDDFNGIRFGRGKTYSLLLMESFWDHDGDKLSELTWGSFRNRHMQLVDDNDIVLKEYSMNRCVIWETELNSMSCHFIDGIWYFVEKEYLTRLNNELNDLFVAPELPDNDWEVESKYNEEVACGDPKFVCLDRSNFGGDVGNIEPCDLYRVEDGRPVFIHVKIGVVSSRLSHLFQQGLNSLDFLGNVNASAKEKLRSILRQKIGDEHRAAEYADALDSGHAKVVFAIICRKDPALGINALPLFSRITLSRVSRAFKRTRTSIEVQLVKDNYDRPSRPRKHNSVKNTE